MGTGELNAGGKSCDELASHPGRVEILLVASCYGNRDKFRPDVIKLECRPYVKFYVVILVFLFPVDKSLNEALYVSHCLHHYFNIFLARLDCFLSIDFLRI